MSTEDWADDPLPENTGGPTRVHRVYGPPGTGKTTFLSKQCRRAADRYGGQAVAVASLTRAAAEEVASRDTGVPRQMIGTLHAHAYRTLGHPKVAEGADGTKLWNQQARSDEQLNPTRDDPDQGHEPTLGRSDGERMMQDISTLRARMLDVQDWPGGKGGRLARFYERWCRFKHEHEMVDFTDLIELAADPQLRMHGRPAVLMVDEAQDLSALEMRLVDTWRRQVDQLVTVGDPDQNLYEWRGSDPHVFSSGESASERVLKRSHRVPKAVHEVAVEWIERIGDREPVAYEPRKGGVGEVRRSRASWQDPDVTVREVAKYARDGSVMVLGSCGYHLLPLVQELRDLGIPFHNPYRPTNGAWNPMRGAARMLAFLRPDRVVWGEEARHWTWHDLQQWAEPLESAKVFRRGAKTRIATMVQAGFGHEPSDAGWLLDQLVDDATAEAVAVRDLDWYRARLLAARRRQMEYPMSVARRDPRLLREQPRVVVGTIHSVKGGEADTVLVFPDLSGAAFYGAADRRIAGWDAGGAARHPTVRLFYVAMTRARERLVLAAAGGPFAVDFPRV